MAVVCGQAVEDQALEALIRRGDLPVVAMLDGRYVVPERRQSVARMWRHLLAHRDHLLREDALHGVEGDGLVPQRMAGPLHRGSEQLPRDVRQQVPRDGQQHVRGQVWVLACLVVDEALVRGHAETAAAQLLVRKLAADRHLCNCALQGALDLLQDLLDLRRQVAPPGVNPMPDVSSASEERHEHGACALVRLALLALHEDHLLVIAVAPEVPLHELCGGVLELLAQDLLAPPAQSLEALVDDDLHIQLCLETAPVALQLDCGAVQQVHVLPPHQAAKVGLDGRRAARLLPLQLALCHTAGEALDLARAAVRLLHGAAAVEAATVGALYRAARLLQHHVAAAAQQAAEGRLEAREVAHHLLELLAHQEAAEDGLDAADAVHQLHSVVLRLVLAEPALKQRSILAVAAVDLLDIPHHLALLDDDRRIRLALDAAPRDGAADVALQQRDGLLLVRLGEDVRGVVRDHVVGEVVVVAVDARGQTWRLQALQVPVLLRCLQEGGLERVRVEEQPSVAAAGTILVRLVVT
mmetsp:Transcript_47697/g.123117  ORF Transcript_47697/g.123117 Transcript_47697/m.123117 type:complete len:525 (+) Transcript_47697:1315-2889(+)